MNPRVRCLALVALGVASLAPVVATSVRAQRFEDVRAERETALDPAPRLASLGSREAEWVGWTVDAHPGAADLCCLNGRGGGARVRTCDLSRRDNGWGTFRDDEDETRLSARRSDPLLVLAEVERGLVRRIQLVGARCSVHGGGRRLVMLEGVDPAKSLALLERLVLEDREEDVRERAIAAMAQHLEGAPSLARMLRASRRRELQRPLLFWLALSDDPRGLAELERILLR